MNYGMISILDVELRSLAVGRFSRSTGCDECHDVNDEFIMNH